MTMRRVLATACAAGLLAVAFACGGCAGSSSGSSGPASHVRKTTPAPVALTGTIAFRRYFTPDESWSGIFTVGSGGKVRQLTDPPRGELDDQPSWSPDGTFIVFSHGCSPTIPCRLYRVAPDGTGLAPIGPHCSVDGVTAETCSDDSNPSVSPDSRWVLFTQSSGRVREDSSGEGTIEHSALAITRTDGSRRHVLLRRAPFSGDLVYPALSPDGKQLVFEEINSSFVKLPGARAVFVMGTDGSKPRRLTPWAENDGNQPVWSPDGKWLVFESHVEDGSQSQYFLIHPDGSGRRQISDFGDGTWLGRATFSPDGRSIAFAMGIDGANAAIYTMRLDGSHVQQVTHSAYWDSASAWGPAS